MDDVNNIKSIVSDVLAQYNVELVDFNLHLLRRAYKIKVVVSKKQGITLDECVKLNKEIAARIEQNNEDNFLYDLEVSSPGLDRVLKKEKDF
ncbi:MAG: ribosome maturation factor RimP, partial [Candidatus Omnitrophota bacterium]